jgi:hypothetical protein
MKANPILEELWKIKDDLAREPKSQPANGLAQMKNDVDRISS